MSRPFCFDGRWCFSATPDDLWRAFSETERFQEWWPWLRELESPGLVEGTVSHGVVRAPVPYALRFDVAILEVDPPRLLTAAVSGDLVGPARLEVAARPGGSEARLSWSLQVRSPLLGAASAVARPLMEWGHNWVVDTGVGQFRRAALGERAPGRPR